MKEKQNITIKIADVAPIGMEIDPADEEIVRIAERNVNKLWSTWRNVFDSKTSKEILAMVAYQFARRYYQLARQAKEQETLLADFEKELDTLLDISNARD